MNAGPQDEGEKDREEDAKTLMEIWAFAKPQGPVAGGEWVSRDASGDVPDESLGAKASPSPSPIPIPIPLPFPHPHPHLHD